MFAPYDFRIFEPATLGSGGKFTTDYRATKLDGCMCMTLEPELYKQYKKDILQRRRRYSALP